MTKHILSRLLALVIFFSYTGGIVVIFSIDFLDNFKRLNESPITLIVFYIWGLIATAFGVFLWNDKGKSL